MQQQNNAGNKATPKPTTPVAASAAEHTDHQAKKAAGTTNGQPAQKQNGAPAQNTVTPGATTVNMTNYSFEPASVTVPPGTRVTWTNKANTTHTSTSGANCSSDGKWNSGNLAQGESYSYTFQAEGDYSYYCIPHCSMDMTGVVHVAASAAKPTAAAGSDSTQPRRRKKGPVVGFKSLDVISAPSTYVLNKYVLDVSIYHRFDNITGPSGGGQVLFGLDNMRDVRIALAYGLFKRVTIGIARSKGDWFNAPYQQVKNLYDGSIRVKILQQDTCGMPVTLTAFGNTVYTAMKAQENTGGEADFHHESDRFSHSAHLMVSRDFGKRISWQVTGAYVRRNWVNCCAGSEDDLDILAVGTAGRIALTQKLALIGEYYYVFSPYHRKNSHIFFNPLAVGLEINTGGHVFHLNFSNSVGLMPNTYLPYTTSSWTDNGIRFGFSIARKFNMNNIKRK